MKHYLNSHFLVKLTQKVFFLQSERAEEFPMFDPSDCIVLLYNNVQTT